MRGKNRKEGRKEKIIQMSSDWERLPWPNSVD